LNGPELNAADTGESPLSSPRATSTAGTGRTPPVSRVPATGATRRRRRPSGEPPPLPRALRASGMWWLGLVGLLAVSWVVIEVTRRPGIEMDVLDNRIVTWLSGLRTPILTAVMRAVGVLATSGALLVMWWA